MNSNILGDTQIQAALQPVIAAAPNGITSLDSLDDGLLMQMLTHTDQVKVVWPTRYIMELLNVDLSGYSVYDHTFTLQYTIQVNSDNPADLNIPGVRNMRFGSSFLDMNFMLHRQHGDVFYISYGTGTSIPRVLMVVVLDPKVA